MRIALMYGLDLHEATPLGMVAKEGMEKVYVWWVSMGITHNIHTHTHELLSWIAVGDQSQH